MHIAGWGSCRNIIKDAYVCSCMYFSLHWRINMFISFGKFLAYIFSTNRGKTKLNANIPLLFLQITISKNVSNTIKVLVFWFVTARNDEMGHQHFGGLRCLNFQGEVRRWRPRCPPKLWYPAAPPHIISAQGASNWISLAVKTSNTVPIFNDTYNLCHIISFTMELFWGNEVGVSDACKVSSYYTYE